MLSYKDSLKILKETNALLEGHFILSSGLHSSQYVQCAQLLSKPHKAVEFCKSLAEKIDKEIFLKMYSNNLRQYKSREYIRYINNNIRNFLIF